MTVYACEKCIHRYPNGGCLVPSNLGYVEQCKHLIEEPKPKPMTNFQRITQSEEALTSWLDEHVGFCMEICCDECVANKECWRQGNDTDYSNAELWYAWLKQESDTE